MPDGAPTAPPTSRTPRPRPRPRFRRARSSRRRLSRMGAQVTINAAKDDVVKTVLAETAGEGADVVCEMSGVPSALHQAFASVSLGGRVQLLGIPTAQVPIDFANEIIFKGITIYGVIGRKMYKTW